MQPYADRLTITEQILAYIKQLSSEMAISSWHCLFPDVQQVAIFRQLELHIRENVQFHWFNKGYQDFDDFLSKLTARKRKMIKRERERIQALDIRFLHLRGSDVSAEQWQIFFHFYTMTYFKKGGLPYLNLAFFQQLAATMGEKLLLIFAIKAHDYIAASLSFVGKETLYGRYWGCVEEYSSLHFETCYYQGIDYCIAHQLSRFDSGAQGEHKISRGFEPVTTYSAHWIDNAMFDHAIKQFLDQEQQVIEEYKNEATTYLPFKAP
jgi:predicted N-acyltransferase